MFARANLRLLMAVCLMAGVLAGGALGQGMVITIGFRNDLKTPVIIQGVSQIGGMVRRGPPIVVLPGRLGGDFNVPAGRRIYNVYDANQPTRVLARDVTVNVLPGRNLSFAIKGAGNQAMVVPE